MVDAKVDSKSDAGKSLTLSQQLGKQGVRGPRLNTVNDIKAATIQEYIKDQPTKKPFKLDVGQCLTLADMEGIQEQVLPIETIEEFHKFQDRWEDASEIAGEIFSGVQKTANDIISHHTGVMRAALRKKKAQEAFEQKEEIKKIRQQASEAAQLIKKRMEPASVVTHEIYKVNFAGIPAITPLPCLTNPPELESESAWARPFLLSNDDIKLWLGDDKVQEVLTRYGCGYQKEVPKAKLAESCGRTQQRIDNENVIASAKELMDKMICKQVDISSVDGGEQFMKGQWLYGFLPHPDMAFCGFAPNNAAVAKIMAVGQVKVLLVQLSSLIEISKTKVGPPIENLSSIDLIRAWDSNRLKEMCEAGVMMFQGVHGQGQLLFVPQGWIIVEVSMVGSRLIYGYRKAFMQSNPGAIAEYKCGLAMYRNTGRMVDRMQNILECMEA